MWIKLIGLLVTSACINASERPRRATVLTDESKRILDIFDFSNFDKQEALSYIDRQRFENLIRGKRSKWNLKQSFWEPNINFDECRSIFKGYHGEHELVKKSNGQESENNLNPDKNPFEDGFFYENGAGAFKPCKNQDITLYSLRKKKSTETQKKGENFKKTTKSRRVEDENNLEEEEDDDDEDYDEEERRKRKKKKKRKRRRYWSKWNKWSPCSVTCGKGRRIRSRKCIAKFCPMGEIEMGEKTCQLPACSLLDKLFSLFK